MSDPTLFYDAFAQYYDLIFEDWEQSMVRQGAFLAELIARELPTSHDPRVLDAAAGIGHAVSAARASWVQRAQPRCITGSHR